MPLNHSKNKHSEIRDFKATQYAFTDCIRDPEIIPEELNDIEPRRLKIYQDLFFNNINNFISSNFPVLKSIISDDNWQKLVREFMIHHHCQSPIFAEIGREFIQFLESASYQKSDLANELGEYVIELAYYEWMELLLEIDQATITWSQHTAPIDSELLSQSIKVSPLSRLGAFSYPVHHISNELILGPDDKKDTTLLVYRDRGHQVHFMELAPLSAMLYQALAENEKSSLESSLKSLQQQINFEDWEQFKQAGLTIVNQWLDKDILYL